MHVATHRRRRELMTRRRTRGPRRGVTTAAVLLVVAFALLVVAPVMGTAGGLLAAYAYFGQDLPDPRILDDVPLAESSYVYDRSGQTLLARFECENRESVEFDEVPEVIISATVASEDRTFWTNPGIDITGIGRAALANLEAGQIVQGASTITQQVIKYADVTGEERERTEGCVQPTPNFLSSRSYEDKIREQILALQVTQAYPGRPGKEQIIETYLNLIYYGNLSYGIKAAAANYFGLTDLSQMTVAQAAFLAGLPQAPSFLDPFQNPDGAVDAIRERNLVLASMLRDGYITDAQYAEALATTAEQMNFRRLQSVLIEGHFTYYARQEAIRILEELGADPIDTGGYRISTTLDYDLQQLAHQKVAEWVYAVQDKNVHNGALIAINSETGEIVAHVGSIDYNNREDPRVQGQFDVAALGVRQPGSAMKPLVYSGAFRNRRATPATLLVDAWTEFSEGGSYRPSNADNAERGPVLATDALRYSLNIPSVKMQYMAGVQETADFLETMGITEDIMALDPGLTLTLGSVPLSLLEMTQAYSVFAQEGELHPATAIREIRDRDNRVIYSLDDDGPEVTQPMTPAEAYLTHWILEGNTDPAKNVLWGTRAMLTDPFGFRREAGFKTGTTDNYEDVSGFGYVPGGLVTGVWMGNNNQEPMSSVLGVGLFSADGPLYLWRDFMQQALNGAWEWNDDQAVPRTTFQQPAGVVQVSVCRWTGMVGNCDRTQVMPFLQDNLPRVDFISGAGCLDLPGYERAMGHPFGWVAAAQQWSDRQVNDEFSGRGTPYRDDPNFVRFPITTLWGEGSHPTICGVKRATPTPSASPSSSGGGGGSPAPSGAPTPTPTPCIELPNPNRPSCPPLPGD